MKLYISALTFGDSIVVASSSLQRTAIGATLCHQHFCGSFQEVKTLVASTEAGRHTMSLDLVGHFDGGALKIGNWEIAANDQTRNQLKMIGKLMPSRGIQALRLLGCDTGGSSTLMTMAHEAINMGAAESHTSDNQLDVHGTHGALSYEHFDLAGLKCSVQVRLARLPRGVMKELKGSSKSISVIRRDGFYGQAHPREDRAHWPIVRISWNDISPRLLEVLDQEVVLSNSKQFLTQPDIEYVFCRHLRDECGCGDLRSIAIVLGGRGLLAYQRSRYWLALFDKPTALSGPGSGS